VIRDELARGDLVEILRDWSCYRLADGGLPVYVVYAQTASAEPPLKSRVFVDFIKEILAREVLPSRPGHAGGQSRRQTQRG
jgi:DNA-binding transcriptional LysR family regulator